MLLVRALGTIFVLAAIVRQLLDDLIWSPGCVGNFVSIRSELYNLPPGFCCHCASPRSLPHKRRIKLISDKLVSIRAPIPSDRPKLKGSRAEATAEEFHTAVGTFMAGFGTWSVNETDKTLTRRVEGALIPNAEGTEIGADQTCLPSRSIGSCREIIINPSISNCTFFLTLAIGHDSSAA